jgi:hypothetical protein
MHAMHVHTCPSRNATCGHPRARNEERTVLTAIYLSDPAITLHLGDARDVLAAMPDESADCIVTNR